MSEEKAVLISEKGAGEQERVGLREELVRVEQDKMDLETDKSGVYSQKICSSPLLFFT